jgi:hypothetical protein
LESNSTTRFFLIKYPSRPLCHTDDSTDGASGLSPLYPINILWYSIITLAIPRSFTIFHSFRLFFNVCTTSSVVELLFLKMCLFVSSKIAQKMLRAELLKPVLVLEGNSG